MTERPHVDVLSLVLGRRMSVEEAEALISRHITVLPFDEFWAGVPDADAPLTPVDAPTTAMVSTSYFSGGFPTCISGWVSPALGEADLLELARQVAADGQCAVLVDDVTLISDCRGDHFLVVQPDGTLVHVVDGADLHDDDDRGPVVSPVDVDPLRVHLPVKGVPQPHIPGSCDSPPPGPDGAGTRREQKAETDRRSGGPREETPDRPARPRRPAR